MNENPLPTATRNNTTKCSLFLCATIALVSFLGYLPKFAPFVCFSLRNCYSPKFPKLWTLVTGMFYIDKFFPGAMACMVVLMSARIVEPIIGSKEYLRVFVMCGFYSGILITLFLCAAYAATRNKEILERRFVYVEAGIGGILIVVAHRFYALRVPTLCGMMKVRELPFWVLFTEVLVSLFTKADGMISMLFGMILSYVYIRFIAKNGERRGYNTFDFDKLLPDFRPDDEQQANYNNVNEQNNAFRGTAHTIG